MIMWKIELFFNTLGVPLTIYTFEPSNYPVFAFLLNIIDCVYLQVLYTGYVQPLSWLPAV